MQIAGNKIFPSQFDKKHHITDDLEEYCSEDGDKTFTEVTPEGSKIDLLFNPKELYQQEYKSMEKPYMLDLKEEIKERDEDKLVLDLFDNPQPTTDRIRVPDDLDDLVPLSASKQKIKLIKGLEIDQERLKIDSKMDLDLS